VDVVGADATGRSRLMNQGVEGRAVVAVGGAPEVVVALRPNHRAIRVRVACKS